MKLFKGKYGWSVPAHGKELNGEEVKNYLEVQFKKGSEPPTEEFDGKLIFRSQDGTERDGFFSSYRRKDGTVVPKLVLILPTEKSVQTTLTGDGRDVMGHTDVSINPEELPFY